MDDDVDRIHRWEITPHPYDSDYDIFVTDDDQEARDAILYAAEMLLWDDHPGGTKTLVVELNQDVIDKGETDG